MFSASEIVSHHLGYIINTQFIQTKHNVILQTELYATITVVRNGPKALRNNNKKKTVFNFHPKNNTQIRIFQLIQMAEPKVLKRLF
jgi:hypothetical protein